MKSYDFRQFLQFRIVLNSIEYSRIFQLRKIQKQMLVNNRQ